MSVQADLDAINDAINSGALSVTYGEPPRRTVFRSLAELQQVKAALEKELGAEPATRSRPLQRKYGQGRSGWY
jgi:hypothetical protein